MKKHKPNWTIRDNGGHDVLDYGIDDGRFVRDPTLPLYGVTFFTLTLDQRDEIRRLVEDWNSQEA